MTHSSFPNPCLNTYPPSCPRRLLGEGNMCTLLWTNARGLQVLRNDVSVDPRAISRFGMPTTTGSMFFPRDRDYCDVQVDYSRNPLIFTISDGERVSELVS